MSWLRPAALYLTLTALIGGSIWLFWGKAIEQKLSARGEPATNSRRWKQLSAEATKPETKIRKLPEKKIPLKPDLEKSKTGLDKISPREEWQKAQSGMIALIAIEAADNRSQLMKLNEFNENRWYELLRRPKPGVVMPAEKKTAKPEPAKLAERPLSKRKAK